MLIKTDGGSKQNSLVSPAAWAFVVYDKGHIVHSAGGYMNGTCSEAEYKALVEALRWAGGNLTEKFKIQSDSKLVVEQTNGRWKCKNPRMKQWHDVVMDLIITLPTACTISHIPREKNVDADRMCTRIMEEQENLDDQADGFKSQP